MSGDLSKKSVHIFDNKLKLYDLVTEKPILDQLIFKVFAESVNMLEPEISNTFNYMLTQQYKIGVCGDFMMWLYVSIHYNYYILSCSSVLS